MRRAREVRMKGTRGERGEWEERAVKAERGTGRQRGSCEGRD